MMNGIERQARYLASKVTMIRGCTTAFALTCAMLPLAPVHATGDGEAGKRKAVVCSACHGRNGISANPAWPSLAGRPAAYLAKQIKAFRAGERTDPVMVPMVANLTDEDIDDLAAYYASRPSGTSTVMYAAKRSNVRSGPGTGYGKVGLLELGEKVRVTAKTGSWLKLEPKAGQQRRFVYAPLLTTEPSEASGGTKRAAASSGLTTRTITYNDGARYRGQTRDGRLHGRGTYTWKGTGEYAGREGRYEGEWRNGKRNGHGSQVWPAGARYEGEWRNGKRNGHGSQVWPDGDRYEGNFVDGELTGRGVFTWGTGNRYEGDFVDGKQTGRGRFTFADGDGYTQEWRDGKARHVHKPSSTCLDVKRSGRGLARWVNRCPVGIDVTWRDEGGCQSRPDKKFPCGWFVGANDKALAAIEGHVWWHECKSPGGHGDVIAMEKGNGVYCLDSPTSRSQGRWSQQASRVRKLTREAVAVAARREERQRRWEEELEEEEEREQKMRRARRSGQVWQDLGNSVLKNSQRLYNEAMAEQARREAAQRRQQTEGTRTFDWEDCANPRAGCTTQ